MTDQAKWAADLFAAADELGYLVMSVDNRRIVLVSKGSTLEEVAITSVFLSGDMLRTVLLPQHPREKVAVFDFDNDKRFTNL